MNDRTRRAMCAGVVLLTAGAVVALLWALIGQVPWWLGDLKVYDYGGDLARAGRPLYAAPLVAEQASADQLEIALWFTYPPFAALLFAPLALLPLPVFGALLQVATVASVLALVWLVHGALAPGRRRLRLLVGLAPLLIFLSPVAETLMLGQISVLLVLAVAADLMRPPDARWRGVGVGLAAGIKIVPAVFIVHLFLTGQRRAALTATATFAGTVAAGFAVFGADSWAYWTRLLWDAGRVGEMHVTFNQSVHGVVARLLHAPQAGTAGLVVAALALAAGLWTAVRLHRRGFAAEALMAVGMTAPLVTPIGWHHHWSWIVPVLVLLWTLARRARSALMWAFTGLITLLYTGGLFYLASPYPVMYPSTVAGHLLAAVFAIGWLCLLVAAGVRCRRRDRGGTPAAAEPPAYRRRLSRLAQEVARFGVVGAVAYVIDVGGSNLLWMVLGEDHGHLTGKALAAAAATTFAYFGNRHWTFRHRGRGGLAREYAVFAALNLVAAGISLLCLAFTVYVLHLDSLLAKNVAANVVGVVLGTVFRFWSYKKWVFLPRLAELAEVEPAR
ncbi:glycosyltransferase 87 family protein [Nonomuraea sp. NPDC050783]|uniref:glycosyltransferase 87 family protein n=1 Tax=Nonomuraea sp. NPDC050783 TaxID=3154634 RepID=UPI003466A629